MQNSALLEHFVVFMLDIKLWTGRKTLKPEDLAAGGIDLSQLPPGTLASLGSKRIISQDALAPFTAIKREAEKLCLSRGIRFLGGYAIPAEEAEGLAEKLQQLNEQFQSARDQLLRHYDEEVERWIDENPPQWSSIIRAAIEPASSVRRALQFQVTPITISAPEGLNGQGLSEQADGLLAQLCHEVRQAARTAYQSSYLNKTSVTRKALRPILTIRQKLSGLMFLDPLVAQALISIDETLALIPSKGALEGVALNLLAGLLGRQLAQLGRPQQADDLETELENSEFEERKQSAEAGPAVYGSSALAWDF